MYFFKLLLLVCSCYHVYSSESSEEIQAYISNPDFVAAVKGIITEAYNENKLSTISKLLELKSDIENITLVGSQNIYGTNGEVVEVKTIELHWPKVSGKSVQSPFDDDDDDDDTTLAELRGVFKLLSGIGFDMSVEAEEFDKGLLIERGYIDKDLAYEFSSGIGLSNKTIEVESTDDVENAIAELKKNHDSLSVHKFNEHFQFVSEGSHIVPEYVANIQSSEGETNKLLFDRILKELSNLIIENGGDNDVIPGKLAQYLKTKYPDTDFYVFNNEPEGWHLSVKETFRVTAEYDLSGWDGDENIDYTVFGFKKH